MVKRKSGKSTAAKQRRNAPSHLGWIDLEVSLEPGDVKKFKYVAGGNKKLAEEIFKNVKRHLTDRWSLAGNTAGTLRAKLFGISEDFVQDSRYRARLRKLIVRINQEQYFCELEVKWAGEGLVVDDLIWISGKKSDKVRRRLDVSARAILRSPLGKGMSTTELQEVRSFLEKGSEEHDHMPQTRLSLAPTDNGSFVRSLEKLRATDAEEVSRFIGWVDPESDESPKKRTVIGRAANAFKLDAAAFQARLATIRSELQAEYERRLSEIQSKFTAKAIISPEGAREPTVEKMQALFDRLAGKEFDSLERKKELARKLQSLLNRLDLRVLCPRKGCSIPAYIRCGATGNTKHGAFLFEHVRHGRNTHHSSSVVLPQLRVVVAPISFSVAGRPAK